MRSSTAVLLAATALLAGCGASSSAGKFQGDQANVARTIDDYSAAAQSHDTSKICNQVLTAELARRLGNCQSEIGKQLNGADSYDLTVQSVSISGTSAQARVKSMDNNKDRFDMLSLIKSADGRWRIRGLG